MAYGKTIGQFMADVFILMKTKREALYSLLVDHQQVCSSHVFTEDEKDAMVIRELTFIHQALAKKEGIDSPWIGLVVARLYDTEILGNRDLVEAVETRLSLYSGLDGSYKVVDVTASGETDAIDGYLIPNNLSIVSHFHTGKGERINISFFAPHYMLATFNDRTIQGKRFQALWKITSDMRAKQGFHTALIWKDLQQVSDLVITKPTYLCGSNHIPSLPEAHILSSCVPISIRNISFYYFPYVPPGGDVILISLSDELEQSNREHSDILAFFLLDSREGEPMEGDLSTHIATNIERFNNRYNLPVLTALKKWYEDHRGATGFFFMVKTLHGYKFGWTNYPHTERLESLFRPESVME